MCELQKEHLTAAPPPHSSTLHPHIKGEAPSTKGWIHPQTESERLRREARVKKIKRKKKNHFKGENDNTMLEKSPQKGLWCWGFDPEEGEWEYKCEHKSIILTCWGTMLLSIFIDWKHLHLKHLTSLKHRKRPGCFSMSSWKLLWHFQSSAIFNSPHEPDLSGICMKTFWWNRCCRYR